MSDREKLIELLTEFGVGFEISQGQSIICRQGNTKIDGYPECSTVFEFAPDGAFIKMGAWE